MNLAIVSSILIIFVGYWLYYGYHQYQINRWFKAYKIHQYQFELLYNNINGFSLSKTARKDYDEPAYLYGEIEFIDFIALLSLVPCHSNTRFYDLGSGVGKAVIAAALVFDFESYTGIELFSTLNNAANDCLIRLSELTPYTKKMPKIKFICADFLKINWEDGNLFFINATGFVGELWDLLNQQLEKTQKNTIVITMSKPLKSTQFKTMRTTHVMMSWGVATTFISKKI